MCTLFGIAVIATAPGKLILTGEYAVLDGAPALVIAVDRRVVARRDSNVREPSSPFLLAVARECAQRYGADSPAARAALEIAVDSSAFYDGSQKLGLGSSAAVTVATVAFALAAQHGSIDDRRDEILAIALAAHANAQGAKGARGSGADIAAAVHGGAIVFTMPRPEMTLAHAVALLRDVTAEQLADLVDDAEASSGTVDPLPSIVRAAWPRSVALIPFFTGVSADTATLVSQVAAAREANRAAVDGALVAIADASLAVCGVLAAHDAGAAQVVTAFEQAAAATDRLALATGVALVPTCVTGARTAMQALGGTAKTTGAGGGDIAIAVIPATADVTIATRSLIELGCQPLQLTVDDSGVDTRLGPQ